MPLPSDTTTQAWVRLVRAHQTALADVEAALKHAGYPALIWYDVLLELERAGDEGLRPYELEQALMLRQYGVSRLVERMEKSGVLNREKSPEDGRGLRLTISTAGKDLRQRMWSVYGPAIEEAVGSKLETGQAHTLSELLGRLIG